MLYLAIPTIVWGQFDYVVGSEGASIYKYTGPGGNVVIPKTLGGFAVIEIGRQAFSFRADLTGVTIPNTVTFIGDYAFAGDTALTTIAIPDSVITVGNLAFSDCTSLASASIGKGVTNLGSAALHGCTSLTNIIVDVSNPALSSSGGVLFNKTQMKLIQFPGGLGGSYSIPAGVTSVGRYSFPYNTRLTSVAIPGSVTNIEYAAFAGCTSLTNATLPNSVVSIDVSAFESCTSLSNVVIPESVLSIGSAAFAACTSLDVIEVNPLNPVYSVRDGVLFNKDQTTLIQCPAGKRGHYMIPNDVTWIESIAFVSCGRLTSVTIPDGVAYIADRTFASCTSLTSVIIPDGVTSIGYGAFESCASLTSVTIPASVGALWDRAFGSCANLTAAYFLGNAPLPLTGAYPVVIGVPFANDPNVTVYYLPGKSNWGPTYGGARTMLRNPSTEPPGFRAGQFGFGIAGTPNSVLVIEACLDLSAPIWLPVSTNFLNPAGTSAFSDPQSSSLASRFYRFRSP